MKTHSDSLFKLIKSLTSQEKRFFKLFAKKNSNGTTYLNLFDALDSLKDYDEKKLAIILQKKGGIKSLKQFKSYLQETIFAFLEYHHSNFSIEIQLQRYLQRIELLFTKGLFALAKKQVEKATQIAIEHSKFPYLFSIIEWERKIVLRSINIKYIKENNEYSITNELQAIDKYKNIVVYKKISIQVFELFITRGEIIDIKSMEGINKILQNPYLMDEKMAHSLPAKYLYWRTLGDIYFMLKKWQKCYTCLKNAYKYVGQNTQSPSEILNLFSRLIIPLRKLKKTQELFSLKQDAKNFIDSLPNKSLTSSLYNLYFPFVSNFVAHYLERLEIDKALQTSNEIEVLIEKYAQIQNFMAFYFNLSIIYFSKSDYKNALKSANKVIALEKEEVRLDAIFVIKIFNLAIHYELKNEDLLPSLCKSYFPNFEKEFKQNKAIIIIVSFFAQTIHTKTKKHEKINLFISLKTALEPLKKDIIFFYPDFIAWVESKIQNRPIIEIMREKKM